MTIVGVGVLAACSTNPATGEQQFTAFMSEEQEAKIGAETHQQILKQFGYYDDPQVQSYVNAIGQKLAASSERKDVNYTFTVVDSPDVNAFAVPGGYIYVTRGLMALANDEAELASVIGHEIGHITARHSAQQQSRGVLANIGLTAISLATDVPTSVMRGASIGADLYLKSYSRGQEHQADELGIRYLYKAGYNPQASSEFLQNLDADSQLQSKIEGQSNTQFSYFSTHPITSERVNKTVQLAASYPPQQTDDRKVPYLSKLEGMTYGESPKEGIIKGQTFIHPDLGFKFTAPQGYKIINQPDKVVIEGKDALMVFSGGEKEAGQALMDYYIHGWRKGAGGNYISTPEAITVNGMQGVTAAYQGSVSGQARMIRDVVIAYDEKQVYGFTILMPRTPSVPLQEKLRQASFSFTKIPDSEKKKYLPMRLKLFAARAGDSVGQRAQNLPFEEYKEERLRVLNGLKPSEGLVANRLYKTVVE